MKVLKWLCKCFLAGLTAVAILCLIFLCYTFTPVHKENPLGNTDYNWPANAHWFKMTEGISSGRFDANGFNNLAVVQNPDILFVGSSHMEATDVPQDKNAAYFLEQKLDRQYSVYNMGISSHGFTKVCSLLPKTLALYEQAPKYIIIEISSVSIPQDSIESFLQGTIPYLPSASNGLVTNLQRLPFARLAYYQISNGLLDLFMPAQNGAAEDAQEPPANENAYDMFFQRVSETVKDTGTQLIIFYHPTEQFQKDGSIAYDTDPDTLALFTEKCEKYAITFVDMTQPFMKMYEEQNKVPHGFITGRIGFGHLNADGHEAIAQTLAETITQLEREG